MKEPLLSIVVLNYNGLSYLERTIPPLLNLSFKGYELIVVDNGSSDESISYLKSLKRVRLIQNKKNIGYSKGKNIGVKNAIGEYVLLVDNDILVLDKDILEKLLADYKENEFLTIPLLNEGETRTKYYGSHAALYGLKENRPVEMVKILLHKREIYACGLNGGAFFFKKSLWKKVGGYDEAQPFNLDDFDFGPRAWLSGFSVRVYSGAYFLHIGSGYKENKEYYLWRYRYFFSGISRMMFKNFLWWNICLRYPFFLAFIPAKTIKGSFKYKSPKPFLALFSSIWIFLKNLPSTLRLRRQIQKNRKVKNDIFLKIRPVF